MLAKQNRFICTCSAQYRLESDFEEHKRVGCSVQSGKGDSLVPDPDEALEEPQAEEVIEAPAEEVAPKKSRKK